MNRRFIAKSISNSKPAKFMHVRTVAHSNIGMMFLVFCPPEVTWTNDLDEAKGFCEMGWMCSWLQEQHQDEGGNDEVSFAVVDQAQDSASA